MKTAVQNEKRLQPYRNASAVFLSIPHPFPALTASEILAAVLMNLLIFSKPPVSLSGSVFLWDRPVMVIPLTSPFPHLPDSLC